MDDEPQDDEASLSIHDPRIRAAITHLVGCENATRFYDQVHAYEALQRRNECAEVDPSYPTPASPAL
jgi:hypothetical protein